MGHRMYMLFSVLVCLLFSLASCSGWSLFSSQGTRSPVGVGRSIYHK